MSDPVFIVPGPPDGFVGIPTSTKATQEAKFYGEDVYLDVTRADPSTGKPDYVVTAAGDWAVVTGLLALWQSLIRRLITNPGEWATLPEYGVGARQYVKAPDTPANRAELEARIRSQFARDDRVEAITDVKLERLEDDQGPGLQITVFVVAAGRLRQDAPLPVQITLH